MSHNKLTIGTATSDRTSSLSTSLSDLDDVSSTAPNSNEFLKWSGSEWEGGAGGGSSTGVIFIGEGSSQNYSGTNPAVGVDVSLYDSSPINTISGASITPSSNWISSVTLPAGTYLFEASVALTFTTTSTATFQFSDGSNLYGLDTKFGSTDFQTGSVNRTTLTFTGATTITLQIASGSNLATAGVQQGTRHAERSFLSIIQSA